MSTCSVGEGPPHPHRASGGSVGLASGRPKLDHTWKTSQGISFAQPKRETWIPSHGMHIAGSKSFSNSSPRTSDTEARSFTKSVNSSALGGLNFQPSQEVAYPELPPSSCSNQTEPIRPIEKFYALDGWNSSGVAETGTLTCAQHDGVGIVRSVNDLESFRSPLGFHIPSDKLHHAMNSQSDSAASFWQYTLYQGPEGEKHKVKVHYCKNNEAAEAVAQHFLHEEVIGFDIEWMAQAKSTDGIRRNIALIQVASEERIALFHIARYPHANSKEDYVSPTFKKIMESPNITKVGVAIKGDCTRLRNFLDIRCRGLFELSHLHKLVKYCSGDLDKVDRRVVSLAQQVKEHLHLPLLKGEVQTSDWNRDLDYQQIQYAASDSYAGFQLYHILDAKRKAIDPMPPRPAHAERNLAISLGDHHSAVTVDEAAELSEEDQEADLLSESDVSVEELARDIFHIALEDPSQLKAGPINSSIGPSANSTDSPSWPPSLIPSSSSSLPLARPFSTTSPSTKATPASAELDLANDWVAAYTRNASTRPSAPPQALRAYALWYIQNFSIPSTARLLRSPPLANKTVIQYICDAMSLEGLKGDPDRITQMASEYGFYPFKKDHKKLLAAAKRSVARRQERAAAMAAKAAEGKEDPDGDSVASDR